MEHIEHTQEQYTASPYEYAIRQVLIEYLTSRRSGEKEAYDTHEVQIDGARAEDMAAITEEGAFSIENIRVTPDKDEGKSFHFRVGKTDFHITGQAAEKIEELKDE